MTGYLKEFFERFGYEKDDADYFVEQLSLIEASDAKEKWSLVISDYENGVKKPFSTILEQARECGRLAGVHDYTTDFIMCACLSRGAERFYEKNGLSTEIYEDSILDLRYKLEECKLVKGIKGTFVAGWFDRWFDVTRFALGRLQFELIDAEYDYEKDGRSIKKGDKAINVHIPRTGTPFTPEKCQESFDRAAEFFKEAIKGDIAFVCHSWLLYPPLIDELSDRMNTKKFAQRFDIISRQDGDENDHGESWRLFDHDYNGDPDSLDTSTSLRAAFVSMIKKTNKSGWGSGIFFYNK